MHAFTQQVASTVARVQLRQREQQGELRRLRSDLDKLSSLVAEMSESDKIAAAVLEAQRADRRNWWTVTRVVGAGVAGLLLLVPAVHELVRWISG